MQEQGQERMILFTSIWILSIGPHKIYFTYDEDPNQQAIVCAKYPLGMNSPEMAQLREIIRTIEKTTVPKRGAKVSECIMTKYWCPIQVP